MAKYQTITRSSACTTRRALIAALAMTPAAAMADETIMTRLPASEPYDWGESGVFLSRFHRTGAAAVAAARGALAHPDDVEGVYMGKDRVLRIMLPGGIAVSAHGVETY